VTTTPRAPQSDRDLVRAQLVVIGKSQHFTIRLVESAERVAHRRPALLRDQRGQRVAGMSTRCVIAGHPLERLVFPSLRPLQLHADVAGRLIDERGERGRVLDARRAERLSHASQRLLSNILGRCRIPEPPRGEHANPVPKPGRQLGFRRQAVRSRRAWLIERRYADRTRARVCYWHTPPAPPATRLPAAVGHRAHGLDNADSP